MPPLKIDLTSCREQLCAIIKDSTEAAVKHVAAVMESKMRTMRDTGGDIAGMREQITANAKVLLSHLMPDVMGPNTSVYVVVMGTAPAIRAYVMYGHDTKEKKTAFIWSDNVDTATAAIERLLEITMKIVETRAFCDHVGSIVRVSGGGGYTTTRRKDSPLSAGSEAWWGSNSPALVNSSFGSVNGSFNIHPAFHSFYERSGIDGNGSFASTVPDNALY